MRNDFGLLRNRKFALLFSARAVSVLGSAIGPLALAFGTLSLPGAGATALSLVLGAQAVPEIIFILLGGVIADRFPRYRVMVTADILAGLTSLLLGVVFLTNVASLPLLMTLAALHGIASAMFFPAMAGIVPQVAPADRLQSANGLLRLTINGAQVLGLASGGLLVALVGPGWALVVDGLTFLVSAVLLAGVRVSRSQRVVGGSVLADLREGWREFSSRQWIWVVVLQFALVNMAFAGGMGVLGPVLAEHHLGGAAGWSMVLAAEALGTVCGVFVAMRIRPSRPILVGVLSTFFAAVPFLLLGSGAPLLAVAAAGFVTGVCFDIFTVLWDTALQRNVPASALSRVSSYDGLGSYVLGPLGMVVAGPVAAALGITSALYLAAATVAIPTALALLSPAVRRLPLHPVKEVGVQTAAANAEPVPAS